MNKKYNVSGLSNDALLAVENELCEYARKFVNFGGHAIYFPTNAEERSLEFLKDEQRLLIPLRWRGNFIGELMLTEVDWEKTEKAAPFLPAVLDLVLENLALSRALDIDQSTGLANEEEFYSHLEQEAANLQTIIDDPGQSLGQTPFYKLCLGMLVLKWIDADAIAEKLDLDFCRETFHKMARIIKSVLPDNVKAAVLGNFEGRYEIGLIMRAPGPGACQKLSSKMKAALEGASFTDMLSGAKIFPAITVGYALYPQDMQGQEMRLSRLAQSFLLRDRARLAAKFAHAQRDTTEAIMPFNQILSRGGMVTEKLGHGKLRINLGTSANAREGHLFNVFENDELRNQIVVLETRRNYSICEVVYVEKAGVMPEPGNTLRLVEDTQTPQGLIATEIMEEGADKIHLMGDDAPQKIWSHGEFLGIFSQASGNYPEFSLGIARLGDQCDKNVPPLAQSEFLNLLNILLNELKSSNLMPTILGRYGTNSLIFFHGSAFGENTLAFYKKLHELAAKQGLKITCGIFSYPFLNYTRGESESCALKALEYAQLLPEPAIGQLDSLALNISADKLYSLGDTFGAIEEYKLALLADPKNAMARNSLGVCMADIGKREQATRLFNEALGDADEDALKAKIHYNLGVVFQKRDEPDSAAHYYIQCVRLAPEHVYAWLRLGQLKARQGSKKAARKFFERASQLARDMPEIKNIADRQLAQLDVERGDSENARERLHNALLRDPEDAATMLLLAKSYLKNNEDLAMAEMLARKSAALTASDEAWKILAAVLVEQGKMEEARQARARGRR